MFITVLLDLWAAGFGLELFLEPTNLNPDVPESSRDIEYPRTFGFSSSSLEPTDLIEEQGPSVKEYGHWKSQLRLTAGSDAAEVEAEAMCCNNEIHYLIVFHYLLNKFMHFYFILYLFHSLIYYF